VLGVITGALGIAAIAATTVAVEGVVLRHLEHQLSVLEGIDRAAIEAISSIACDERQHHDDASLLGFQNAFWSKVLTPIVSASTEAVIWLGMRL